MEQITQPEKIWEEDKPEEKTDDRIDLTDVTFMVPVRLDSQDRRDNAQISIPYLFKHFRTNLILMEVDKESHDELKFTYPGFTYRFLPENGIFHRTRYLNQMLKEVTTPCVVVHDIDIVLPVESYVQARNKILKEGYAMWHPFGTPPGVILLKDKQPLKDSLEWSSIIPAYEQQQQNEHKNLSNIQKLRLKYKPELGQVPAGPGFSCWFQTEVYRWAKAENEQFVSFGPEDQERFFRFITLGLKVTPWLHPIKRPHPAYPEAGYVCHLEHARGVNSSIRNPFMTANVRLHHTITSLNKAQLLNYYKITGEPPLIK